MKWLTLIALLSVLLGCATRTVHCARELHPINAPAGDGPGVDAGRR